MELFVPSSKPVIGLKKKTQMNKVEELIGKKVRLTKLESVRYKDGHPNGIEEGYTMEGRLLGVKVGWMLEMSGDRGILDYFHTSEVLKMEDNLVYTKNSIYKGFSYMFYILFNSVNFNDICSTSYFHIIVSLLSKS